MEEIKFKVISLLSNREIEIKSIDFDSESKTLEILIP